MKNIQDDYNPSKNKNIAWQPFTQLTLTHAQTGLVALGMIKNKRYEILSTCKITYVNKNMLLFTTNRLVKICYWRLKSIEHIMFATKNCLSDVVCEGWQFDLLFIFDCSVTHR